MDTQNKALKSEISKLESEKSHLMDILAQHEPSCAKKLNEAMKLRQPSSNFDCFESEFRVPLPPASTVPRIPVIKVTGPSSSSQEEPPSFAEAIQMVNEVKAEEEEEIPSLVLDQYFHQGGNSQDYYHHQNPFLAKRNLGQTYLDLDSRCIAL